MKENNIYYFVGNEDYSCKVLSIFDIEVCQFLNDLSLSLMKDKEAKLYSDIITFAFWIRKSNIQRKKKQYLSNHINIGKGIIFHIAPSNVPINFAFSLVFGLLSGNSNIVRVSKKDFAQTNIICKHINKILDTGNYKNVSDNITILSYEHDADITDFFSDICDVRIIWGGNDTINEIRKSPIKPRTTEITFADRYSFSIVSPKKILECKNSELKKLAESFYNDTYLMDQNACSSPHLIVWKIDINDNYMIKKAKEKFWDHVAQISQKWNFEDIYASEKYTLACKYSVTYNEIKNMKKYTNRVYVMNLRYLTDKTIDIRGKLGLFSQIDINSYEDIKILLKKDTQTITYYGIDVDELTDFVKNSNVKGVDRIVGFGNSLELDLIWDGNDMINSLSRVLYIN